MKIQIKNNMYGEVKLNKEGQEILPYGDGGTIIEGTEQDAIDYIENLNEDYVELESGIIIGLGQTMVSKDSNEYVCWETFSNPNSIKDYGRNAVEISLRDLASNYQLSDAGTPIYYDSDDENLTISSEKNTPALIDASDLGLFEPAYPTLKSLLEDTTNVVLKGVNCLVSCTRVNTASIIDTGEQDIKDKNLLQNRACALIDNHDITQDEAVFTAIKDIELTGANFETICNIIIGA